MAQPKHILVIGAPNAGKTTAIRFLFGLTDVLLCGSARRTCSIETIEVKAGSYQYLVTELQELFVEPFNLRLLMAAGDLTSRVDVLIWVASIVLPFSWNDTRRAREIEAAYGGAMWRRSVVVFTQSRVLRPSDVTLRREAYLTALGVTVATAPLIPWLLMDVDSQGNPFMAAAAGSMNFAPFLDAILVPRQ